ncbi:galactan 5-O-arabinofuranosyltransferase [Corynebacterium breve]|uniref:Galactan 5-O-arabinofuranosyltransferase n=1 Tax=Corynebacterium breve TaxID=3049799 RepID=A0ABY8VJW3_9CORY|nr:galactan 5-O-arabinofuranosyltransferase [Corynebacterium breve]WIM67865.1 galactan 5-O-arabinofuranosyltransferase [Corynebacterium breve]
MTVSPTDPIEGKSTAADVHSRSSAREELAPPLLTTEYAPDKVSTRATVLAFALYGFLGGFLTLVAWYILRASSLPAFNTSNVTPALATAGSFIILVTVVVFCLLWLKDNRENRPRPRWRTVLTEALCSLAPTGLVITSLGIPLSATKLYLDGIQVDQGFRTQFLSRMTETITNQDMNYIDMPTYYPIGWFWLGGRLANILNLPGWEVYQPWALISMAIVAATLVPLWRKILGSLPVATALALVTVSIILVMTPEEPYAAVVGMYAPAMAIVLHRAFRGSWPATFAVMLYLGVSALFYTLFTGVLALSVVVLAALTAVVFARSFVPLRQLLVIGFGAIAIALIGWGPYVWEVLTGAPHVSSTAPHYLPTEDTQFPVPFLTFSVIGFLCLAGLIYMLIRFSDPEIRMLAVATCVFYLWALASKVATLAGTTLLGFRMETLIVLFMSTAGVLALAELRLLGFEYLYPDRFTLKTNQRITRAFVVIVSLAGLFYVQQIPAQNQSFIDQAYQDTDGYGERADRFSPDAGRYYSDIDQTIRRHGYEPTETVVFTDEINFMAYYPYHGFNAFTSHYANPLGEFDTRNDALNRWAQTSFDVGATPEKFIEELDSAPWKTPDVFIFKGKVDDSATEWKSHVAVDIFPNQPNVRYEAVYFNPEVFSSNYWATTQIGPFVVTTRIQQ